jgi:hypothetical protein
VQGGVACATKRKTDLERVKDRVPLVDVLVKGHIPGFRGVDHERGGELPRDVAAERDGCHLVDLPDDVFVDVEQLKVAAALPALAQKALGHRVEGNQLHALSVLVALPEEAERKRERKKKVVRKHAGGSTKEGRKEGRKEVRKEGDGYSGSPHETRRRQNKN